MDHVAASIVPPAKMMMALSELMLDGITPDRFARKPEGIDTNSPAFVYGHLAIYPDRFLRMIGREDLAIETGDYEALFGAGKECRDDPDGAIYPSMDEIVERFRARHHVAIEALMGVSDEVMGRENPMERMRERLPTMGAMASFLFGGHPMMHLGQVSAWRRAMGLRPAM